jgi:hypothetical protein
MFLLMGFYVVLKGRWNRQRELREEKEEEGLATALLAKDRLQDIPDRVLLLSIGSDGLARVCDLGGDTVSLVDLQDSSCDKLGWEKDMCDRIASESGLEKFDLVDSLTSEKVASYPTSR